MLRHFHLFNLLAQGGTVTLQSKVYFRTLMKWGVNTYSAVFSGDADLACALRL